MKKISIFLMVLFIAILTVSGFGCKSESTTGTTAAETTTIDTAAAETTAVETTVAETTASTTETADYWVQKAGIKPSGTLTIYSYKDEGVTEWKIAKEFEKMYPEVKINWISIPAGEFVSKLLTEVQTDTAQFDIFWSYAPWTIQFSPFLEDVTSRIPDELKNDILDANISATAFQDKWYGLPLFTSIYSNLYNKDILLKAGYDKPPETWDEYFVAAEKATTDKEVFGLGYSLVGNFGYLANFMLILKTVGGEYWNKDFTNSQPLFNNDKGIRALQIMKTIYKSDFSDPAMAGGDETNVVKSLASGNAAMGVASVGWAEGLAATDFKENVGKFAYSLIPHDPGFESASRTGSMGFVIRKGGNVDAALAFDLFYMSTVNQKFVTDDRGLPASRSSLIDDAEYISKYPYAEAALKQAAFPSETYDAENDSIIQEKTFPILEKYLNGGADEQTTLDAIEKEFIAAWQK